MRILALILARGGSIRLPGKNLRELGGAPLIVWSIDAAKHCAQIADILVSTDSPHIADIAKNAGALVPWLRPDHLSTDFSTSFDAAIHALDWYEDERGSVDGLLLLQPTSPFRRAERLNQACRQFAEDPSASTVSVSSSKCKPELLYVIGNTGIAPVTDYINPSAGKDLGCPIYQLNGSIYLIHPDSLRREKSFVSRKSKPLIMEELFESVDIDTEWDWLIAEEMVKRGLVNAPY